MFVSYPGKYSYISATVVKAEYYLYSYPLQITMDKKLMKTHPASAYNLPNAS